jgi:transcriptional regulator with XRE-family HTH domain
VAGLRREEVAELAGVSADYYVRLERGRQINPSMTVLESLARALRLSDLERDYLIALARPMREPRRPLAAQRVRPGVLAALASMIEIPAVVVGRCLDVLASNRLARALFTDFDALPDRDRNLARYMFLDRGARSLHADWEADARSTVAQLRRYAGGHPNDGHLAELINELSLNNRDFRRWWTEPQAPRQTSGPRRFHHPLVGDLVLDFDALIIADDPQQTLQLHTAEPRSPSEHALRALASWA